jgi:hypothetical protein
METRFRHMTSKPTMADAAGARLVKSLRNETQDQADWTKAAHVRPPNLKPSSTSISPRRPNAPRERIKVAAGKRDVPYPSLIKIWLG